MTQVILHLGGRVSRIQQTALTALRHPAALVLISTESDPVGCLQALQTAGVARSRIWFDYRAWDTVTEFTLLDKLLRLRMGCTELWVVTDNLHARRARAIARCWALGRGIRVHSSTLQGVEGEAERLGSLLGDCARVLVWRLSLGWINLASRQIKRERMPAIKALAAIAKRLQA